DSALGGPPEEAVFRVDEKGVPPIGRRLTISPRKYNLPDEALHRPAVAREPDRKGVEQLGVARSFATETKVVHGADDARPEKVAPDAIGHDPARQGVVRMRQPAC